MKVMAPNDRFESEADLVRAFCACVERRNAAAARRPNFRHDWVIYPETAGFDLVLACRFSGIQVGIEAKLRLNLKVIEQALAGHGCEWSGGPDYRAVLVPLGPSVQSGIRTVANHIGLTVITVYDSRISWHGTHDPDWMIQPSLPDEDGSGFSLEGWHPWLPTERLKLPEYVPDVEAGHKSPVALTQWKIKAIKLMILLDRRGRVTRGDMKALAISPTRWTDAYNGLLVASPAAGGYVRCDATPDFRRQHPRNYAEIEEDFEKWCPPGYKIEAAGAAE